MHLSLNCSSFYFIVIAVFFMFVLRKQKKKQFLYYETELTFNSCDNNIHTSTGGFVVLSDNAFFFLKKLYS